MATRPQPPDPGETRQVGRYSVEAKLSKCCKDPVVRYFVRNIPRSEGIDGRGLLAGGRNWSRLCHAMGWYPLDGLHRDDPLPRTGERPPPKKPPRAQRGALQGPPEPLPIEAYEADSRGQGELF